METVNTEQVYNEIKAKFGFVPEFLQSYPSSAITGAWEEAKGLYLNPSSALTSKLKDLINLAVDSQVSSEQPLFLSTEFARAGGASEAEMREAMAMAAWTRHWSAFLNGIQMDEHDFRRETDKAVAHIRKQIEKGTPPAPEIPLITPSDAYSDMENLFGKAPSFLKLFPENAIVGAWRGMKHFQLNTNTAISCKGKELIGLAVAAQVPCRYCVYFHTEAARLNGATEDEIKETVALSGFSRHWSLFISGLRLDKSKFEQEVQGMVASMRRPMAA